jgi:hypothetical protein
VRRTRIIATAAFALLASEIAARPAYAAQPQPSASGKQSSAVTLKANPALVCHTGRQPSYLNFDLVLGNATSEELAVQEVRGIVSDDRGRIVERRLIWQQSIGLLLPDRTIAPNGEAMIFNPLLFGTAKAGSSVRYEVDLASKSGKHTASATIVPQDCTNPYSMRLPVSGRVLVYDGYDLYSHHRRTGYGGPDDAAQGITDNFQRFGVDLVIVDEQGRFTRNDGSRPDLWLGWGQPVRAAGAGIVAAVHDGQPDNQIIGDVDKWLDRDMAKNPMTSYGNYVLIQHAAREYSLIGHLKQGSVTVRKGQRVKQGDVIGQIGNSGASGGVHVHFERRTGHGIAGIETMPPFFEGVAVQGLERPLAGPTAIDSGDIIIAE